MQARPRNISSLRQLMLGGLATITHVPRDLLDAGHEACLDLRVRQGIPMRKLRKQVLRDVAR